MEITVPSGATVVINVASFEAATNLKNAIEREVAASGNFNISTVLLVDSSESVRVALWLCLARCLYDGQKITSQTFDKKEARQDYYDIVVACVKENLGPLGERLLSLFIEHGLTKQQAPTESAPKSE